MSSDHKRPHTSRLQENTAIYSIRLEDRITLRYIDAKVYPPRIKRWTDEYVGKEVSCWVADYEIDVNGEKELGRSGGADWLQALLVAVEKIRLCVPECQEDNWMTPDGVSSWVALPRLVPISWGYKTYREAVQAIERIEADVHRSIEGKIKD